MRPIPRLLAAIIVPFLVPTVSAASPLEGCWEGTLRVNSNDIRIVAELSGSGGSFHLLARAVQTDSIAGLSVRADTVTFVVPGAPRSPRFTGVLSADGRSFAGEARSGEDTAPFALERIDAGAQSGGAALYGSWEGKLDVGSGMQLTLVMNFSEGPCGLVFATMDSPDQGSNGLPVTVLQFSSGALYMEFRYIRGVFEATLDESADELAGTWVQSGRTFPKLTLQRLDSAPEYARPQDPQPPFPYDVEEVAFENAADGVTLAGTLTIPPGAGPFPACVLITGSGPQDRDELVLGHRPFWIIADYLTRRGIAVLRYDDRGVGGSTGSVYESTLSDTADDVLAAIALLSADRRVDPERIGLIGHSEGGWVAPLVATRTDKIAFIVMLAGPGVGGRDLWLAQRAAMLRLEGTPPDKVEVDGRLARELVDIVVAEPDATAARKRMREAVDRMIAALPDEQAAWLEQAVRGESKSEWDQLYDVMTTRWFRDLMRYDGRSALKKVRCPVLALIGERDIQVLPDQNIPALRRAFASSRHPDYSVRVLPGLNHLFQTAETGSVSEYGRIEETIAPRVLELIAEWIAERVGISG